MICCQVCRNRKRCVGAQGESKALLLLTIRLRFMLALRLVLGLVSVSMSEWVVVVSRSFLEISKDMYAVAMPSRKPDTAYIVVDLERLPMCGRFSDFYRSLARLCLWMRGTGPDHRRVGPQWSP